jgi:hypothetical protein
MKTHKKSFIIKLFIFMSIFLLILFLLNLFYIKVIGEKKLILKEDAEWQMYKNKLPNANLEYAILGDSHARNGANPLFINNSFNFAVGYEDYTETYYKIKKIMEKDRIKVKNFILELDTHTFSDKMRTNMSLFSQLDYYSKFVSISKISRLTGKSRLSLFIQLKIPVIGKGKEMLFYFIFPNIPTIFNLGWTNYTESFLDIDRTASAVNKYKEHFSTKPVLIENRSFNYFKEILKIANENNVGIIIVEYPLSYEYDVELKKHNISREIFYDNIFKEINKINPNYLLLEYYDLFFEHPEYFADSDHLNAIGAEVLSRKINNELLNWEKTQKYDKFENPYNNLTLTRYPMVYLNK